MSTAWLAKESESRGLCELEKSVGAGSKVVEVAVEGGGRGAADGEKLAKGGLSKEKLEARKIYPGKILISS